MRLRYLRATSSCDREPRGASSSPPDCWTTPPRRNRNTVVASATCLIGRSQLAPACSSATWSSLASRIFVVNLGSPRFGILAAQRQAFLYAHLLLPRSRSTKNNASMRVTILMASPSFGFTFTASTNLRRECTTSNQHAPVFRHRSCRKPDTRQFVRCLPTDPETFADPRARGPAESRKPSLRRAFRIAISTPDDRHPVCHASAPAPLFHQLVSTPP